MASNSGKDRDPARRPQQAHIAAQKKPTRHANSLRIIAGEWRGRRIRFPPAVQLRPTPDRVRETLFNWLQHAIADARCLDLFAGSGALGLEALSRGAREVLFVEHDRKLAAALRATLSLLGSDPTQVLSLDAFTYLRGTPRPFDVVFLDPPFALGRVGELCTILEHRGWLARHAYLYLEGPARGEVPALPESLRTVRETRAGEVHAILAHRGPSAQHSATPGGERTGEA